MKKGKIILAVILSFCLVLITFPVLISSANETSENDYALTEEEFEYRQEHQTEALQAYQTLFETFTKNDSGLISYPDDYAGAYIDESCNLVILLTDLTEQSQNEYEQLLMNNQKVQYDEAAYSLNELSQVYDYVADFCNDLDITAYGIYEKQNSAFIEVKTEDASELQERLNRARSIQIPIMIEETEEGNVVTSGIGLYGGDGISDGLRTQSSITIGGTYNGKSALLTCGHGLFRVGDAVYRGWNTPQTVLGKLAFLRAHEYSKKDTNKPTTTEMLGDIGIINLTNNDYSVTNKVRASGSSILPVTGYYSSLPEGTSICKYGAKTGYSYGSVTATGVTYIADYYNNDLFITTYEFRGMTRSYMQNSAGTNALENGDSGGCVYVNNGSSGLIAGILSGTKEGQNPTGIIHTMYHTPIYYAIDAGFTPKTN